MDIITFHSLWTLFVFICFLLVVWWAYSRSRKAKFTHAANLVFDAEHNDNGDAKL